MKKAVINISLLTAVTLSMLLLCEVFVRALYGDTTVLFPRYHTDVQYGEFTIRGIRPNATFSHKSIDGSWTFMTNSQGFRNHKDFDYHKPENQLRVLSIGDSHTQGYEVRQDHTFSAVIERYLERQGFHAEVLNSGVSGFGTAEQLIFLENEGLSYQPDVVVLGFFANDLEDNIKSGLYQLDERGDLVISSYQHIPGVRIQNLMYSIPGIKWLGENSYFYSLLFNSVWEFAKLQLTEQSAEEASDFAIPQRDVYSRYELNLTAALLDRLYSACQEAGVKLIILDIPVKTHEGTIASSIPDDLRAVVARSSDAFVDSQHLLAEYDGVAELHVPNGHNHISEFSHTMLGIEAARYAISWLRAED